MPVPNEDKKLEYANATETRQFHNQRQRVGKDIEIEMEWDSRLNSNATKMLNT